MSRFPTTLEDAVATPGTFRAGGTDLQERRHHRISVGPVVDLRDLPGLDAIEETAEGLLVGARTPIAALAADPRLPRGLAQAAGGLATPQIRNRATVGGNLLQAVRCWYYRSPRFSCLKKGGETCLARQGDHLYHVAFDLAPCAAPHPSTLGMALLALDAAVLVHGGEDRTVEAILGAPLEQGALLTHVLVPAVPGSSAYTRTIARARAEWPLVEAFAGLHVVDGRIAEARVAIGGVAAVPLRLGKVEAALVGRSPAPDVLEEAAALGAEGATPLPMTGYKVGLIAPTIRDALDRALEA